MLYSRLIIAPLMRLLSAVAFSARAFILNCQYFFIMRGLFSGFLDRSLSPAPFFLASVSPFSDRFYGCLKVPCSFFVTMAEREGYEFFSL